MVLALAADPLPLRLDNAGTYRVGQTRVRLDTVINEYKLGHSAEQIAQHFPTLELGDVHAVIAHYLHHRAEIDAYLQQREREAEELRQKLQAEGFVASPEQTAEVKRRFEERQNRKA